MSLIHCFEDRLLNTTEHAFNSVNNYTIQLSSTQDDYLYSLYDSYVTFTVNMKVTKGDATAITSDHVCLMAAQQPSGIIKSASTNYQYINQNGEVMNVVLTDESSYCAAARNIINQLFLTKAEHDRNAYMTEFPYSSSGKSIFDGKIICKQTRLGASGADADLVFDIRVPLGEILQGVNTNSFINLKMLRADLTFVEPGEFFSKGAASSTIKLCKADGTGTISVSHSEEKITKCNITLSTYTGDVSSVPAELRQLRNQQVKVDIIKLDANKNEITQQLTVPFKSSFLIMYFTDQEGNRCNLLNPIVQQWRVGLTGVSDSYKTYFDPNATENDSYWYFINNYCTNCGKEQNTLMTYEAWKNRMHYWILPLNELLPQQAQNLFNFTLKLKNRGKDASGTSIAITTPILMTLCWVKAGEE